MAISANDAMRELHQYAMEEMRNRGLEEAALAIQTMERWNVGCAVTRIMALRRDPSAKLSDWWSDSKKLDVPVDFVPMGA